MTREQRVVFGEVAQQYDDARPSYPDDIFDIVMSFGGLAADDAALEIGGGTGKATQGFLARGLRVHALEPSPGMAEVLRGKGVDVEETTFEDWPVREQEFRLVYAAQAWHWVHGEDRYERLARVLAPGDVVALFWNEGRPHPEPFKTDNDAVYARLWPRETTTPDTEWQLDFVIDEFAQCPSFEPVVKRVVTWETSYTSAEWMQLLATHSHHRMLPDDVRTQLHTEIGAVVDNHGGTLPVVYDTQLYLARRRQSS